MVDRTRPALVALTVLSLSCGGISCAEPATPPTGAPPDAAIGRCRANIDRDAACGAWEDAVADCDGDATVHTSFPQLDPRGCFVPVTYNDGWPSAGRIPDGCGYPTDTESTATHLDQSAARFQAIARGTAAPKRADSSHGATQPMPMSLDCNLPDDALVPAARTNANTLTALARRTRRGLRKHAYAMASTFGYGHSRMGESALVSWRPGDACIPLDKREMSYLSINILRAARASAAYHAGVAPVVSFSGSAVHAPLYEAFMHMHLAVCLFDVPQTAVLLDPCADHTHTNIRNTGSLVVSLGARTAYIVTDDGIQADYLQDFHAFWLIGGEIDQRSKRDWGYLLGSWHQASVGIDAGFWFTPYRFWGEPRDGLGTFTCVR